jgi:thioredoxin reductase
VNLEEFAVRCRRRTLTLVVSKAKTSVSEPPDPLERAPSWLETSMPGVYSAGDIRHGSVKRVAAAVGEGSTTAMFVWEHLTHH